MLSVFPIHISAKQPLLCLVAAITFLAACGDDSGSASGAGENSGPQADISAATFDELPNCSSNREGSLAFVEDEGANYLCSGGHWLFQEPPMDTVATEEDLPACTAKHEGDSLFVKADEIAYVCTEGRWEATASGKMNSYKTEDDLPNCSEKREGESALVEKDSSVNVCAGGKWKNLGMAVANEDALQNCTAKREGNKVYVVETAKGLICSDGKWVENEQTTRESEDDGDDVSSSSTNVNSSSAIANGSSSSVITSSSGAKQSSSSVMSSSTLIDDSEFSSSSAVASSSSAKAPSSSEAVVEVKPSGTYDCGVYNCVSTTYLKSGITYGEILDTRDDQVYKVVTIGTQTWMAQNLNYEYNYGTAKSYCYGDDQDNCDTYGRLYLWSAAMDSAAIFSNTGKGCGYYATCSASEPVQGVCPEGWHLPSKAEWDTLFTNVGGENVAGRMLKSEEGWNYYSESTKGIDYYGFSALPAGYRDNYGSFLDAGGYAGFWSSSESNSGLAYRMSLHYYGEYADLYSRHKDGAFSVRCLQN